MGREAARRATTAPHHMRAPHTNPPLVAPRPVRAIARARHHGTPCGPTVTVLTEAVPNTTWPRQAAVPVRHTPNNVVPHVCGVHALLVCRRVGMVTEWQADGRTCCYRCGVATRVRCIKVLSIVVYNPLY